MLRTSVPFDKVKLPVPALMVSVKRSTILPSAATATAPSSGSAGLTAASVGGVTSAATPVLETMMSSMPTHSSLPAALAVMMRISRSAALFAATPNTTSIAVTCVAVPPVVASATNAALTQLPSPTRYCTGTCWIALSADPSISRILAWNRTFSRPVASRNITRCGASAVPDPFSATTALAIANSATPPVLKVLGLI